MSLDKITSKATSDMSSIEYAIFQLCVHGETGDAERALVELDTLLQERAVLEMIADAARDVNEWLIRNGLEDTAHQMALAKALKAGK